MIAIRTPDQRLRIFISSTMISRVTASGCDTMDACDAAGAENWAFARRVQQLG
jgi:hypothetical protein